VHCGGPAEASRPQNKASLLPCGAISVQFPRTSSFLGVQEKFRLTGKDEAHLWRLLRPAPVPQSATRSKIRLCRSRMRSTLAEQRIVAFQRGLHNFTSVGSSIAEAVLRERHFHRYRFEARPPNRYQAASTRGTHEGDRSRRISDSPSRRRVCRPPAPPGCSASSPAAIRRDR